MWNSPCTRARTTYANRRRRAPILDYLGPNTLVIFDDLLALEDRYASLTHLGAHASHTFASIETFLDQTEKLQKIFFTQQPIEELSEIKRLKANQGGYYSDFAPPTPLLFQMFNRTLEAHLWRHPFVSVAEYLLSDIPDSQQDQWTRSS